VSKRQRHVELFYHDTWHNPIMTCGTILSCGQSYHDMWHSFQEYLGPPSVLFQVTRVTLIFVTRQRYDTSDYHIRSRGSTIQEVLLQYNHEPSKYQSPELPHHSEEVSCLGDIHTLHSETPKETKILEVPRHSTSPVLRELYTYFSFEIPEPRRDEDTCHSSMLTHSIHSW
jgi:hypothetical protein